MKKRSELKYKTPTTKTAKKQSQQQRIKKHLNSGRAITPMEALRMYGCMRLAAHIFDLRLEGMPIETIRVNRAGKRYARYKLSDG